MSNPETTAILEITVIGIAVAQALTILLTIRRERDIKGLRELVDEQRLRIVELRAWLAGRSAVQPSRIKSEREPIPEPTANNSKAPVPEVTPKDLSEAMQSRSAENEAAGTMKALNWSRDTVVGLQSGLKGGAPPEPAIMRVQEPAITPNDLSDTSQPSTPENELERATNVINWLKEDADKAREIVASLHGSPPAKKIG